MVWHRVSHLSVVAVFAFLLTATGCGISILPPSVTTTSPTAQQIESIEEACGLDVPASARPIYFRESNGMDDALELRFELPATEVDAFLASPLLKDASWSNDVLEPDAPRRKTQIGLPDAEFLNVTIDEQSEGMVHVKLVWFEI